MVVLSSVKPLLSTRAMTPVKQRTISLSKPICLSSLINGIIALGLKEKRSVDSMDGF